MSKKENNISWLELCAYVEREIFKYDSNQKLQRDACLILQGLNRGQCVANNNSDKFGDYSYEIVLLTFKANKVKILNSIKGKNFKTESSKMAYIAAIIRNSINDVYTRYNKAKKSEEKIEQVNINAISNDGAEYKTQKNISNKVENKFKELW
ncbi:hypothetical protein [Clostridium sp.]|uniref:hypothetical protein n=1 Tax=Clostridium sp. TaxID=1506 RepID=UPI003217937D